MKIYPDMFSLQTAGMNPNNFKLKSVFLLLSNKKIGILRDKERLILERADADDDNSTPRPLVAIDCKLCFLNNSNGANFIV